MSRRRRRLWTNTFYPTHTSGLQLWDDASDLGTIDATAVGTWSDKSGNGNDATEATNKPASGSDFQNGLNLITFDGSNDILTLDSAPITDQDFTLMCVVRTDDTGFQDAWSFGASSFRLEVDGSGDWNLFGGGVSGAIGSASTFGVVSVRSATSSKSVRYNGGNQITSTNNATLTSNFYLGARAPASQHCACEWAELLIWNRSITDAELNNSGRYLQAKWGLPAWSTV
jgi:hypothetical protein